MVSYHDSRPKWAGKVYTRFQSKTAKKKKPFGAVNAYVVYIKEYPLESSLTPRTKLLARLNSFCEHYFQGE